MTHNLMVFLLCRSPVGSGSNNKSGIFRFYSFKDILQNNKCRSWSGGIINYEKKYSNGDKDSESDPSICLGAGTRYFLNKNLCMTLEIRDLINMKKDNTENNVYFGLGLSFQFNLFPRKSEQDEAVDKLKGYLEEKENHD